MSRLPTSFKGVVYLDRLDRQMILLRNGRAVPLSQSGLAWRERFTFYDQVRKPATCARISSTHK